MAPLLLTVLALPARAGAAPGATLTWESCVSAARAANPSLREADLKADAALARRGQAWGGFLPRLSASGGSSDSGTVPTAFDPIALERWNGRVTASQSLFSGFSTVADVLAASADARAERARDRD